jgi:PAS domain S-box-containing protein
VGSREDYENSRYSGEVPKEEDLIPILLVDDLPANLIALNSALESPAYRIIQAHSGREALDYLRMQEFALILLDIQMPIMDGFEVARRARLLPRAKTTPIIFVTAISDEEKHIQEAYRLGAVDFLPKPIDLHALHAKITVFADLYCARREVSRQAEILRRQERQERSQVLENALDAVIGVDQSDRIIDWNKQAEIIFGWTKNEAIGRPMGNLLIPERYREAHRRGMEHFLKTSEGPILDRRIEVEALRKDGSEFPVELAVTAIKTSQGYKFYSFMRDLTERNNSERAKKASDSQLRLITNALPALVSYVDRDHIYRFVNSAYEKWFLHSRDWVVGKHMREVVGAEAYDHLKPKIEAALSGETVTFEMETPYESGIRFIQANYVPDIDPTTQKVRGIVVLVHDITDQKQFEQTLKEAVRARDEFLSIASHELRTPLTPIKLQLQNLGLLIKSGNSEKLSAERIKKVIAISDKQLTRLTALIEDMLDVARISSGRLTLNLEQQDLVGVIREVCERYAVQAATAKTPLELEAPSKISAIFDRLRIEQVLINLITNAMKYAPGSPIHISIVRSTDHVRVYVRDQGIGISKDDLERVFDRFERVLSSNNVGGLGLGLYISRQIIESHGGRIWAESRVGAGSTFTFELPLKLKGKGAAQ